MQARNAALSHSDASVARTPLCVQLDRLTLIFSDVRARADRLRSLSAEIILTY